MPYAPSICKTNKGGALPRILILFTKKFFHTYHMEKLLENFRNADKIIVYLY